MLFKTKNNLSEAWEINSFYKTNPPPCSKRYKWSTRAKLYNSKRYKWSTWSILIISESCVSLSKGVYRKDDCAKLKIKDSNHTRRSKQNTYHVVNKNIAPSKVTDGRRRKRGCLPGHPQALAFRCPEIILGVPWAYPSLGSCHSLFHNPSNLSPKTWKLHNTKLSWKSRELR